MIDVHISAFADDICLYTTSHSYENALDKMQNALNLFKNWCETWSVTINTDKTYVQYFTRKKINNPPVLHFGNTQLRYQKVCRYLGLLFDSPYLTWKNHIDYLVENCNQRLNILKAVASTTWGAERKTLLHIYRAFILSKITYGSVAYGSASKSLIDRLEVLQNSALRIASGALKSSPIGALRCEVHVPSIWIVIETLTVKYFIKAGYFSRVNPVRSEVLEDLEYVENLRWSHFAYRIPGILRALHSCGRWNIPRFDNLPVLNYSPIPPWIDLKITVILDIGIKSVKNLPASVRLSLSNVMLSNLYRDHLQIFTDGSKALLNNEWRAGSAFYVMNDCVKFGFRLNGIHSVLVAELFAIYKALRWILGGINSINLNRKNVVIFTDSLSALHVLKSGSNKVKFLVFECWKLLKQLLERQCMLVFQWIPSHVGIRGNELVDREAKASLNNLLVCDLNPSLSDLYSVVNCKLVKYLERDWEIDRRAFKIGELKERWEYWPWCEVVNRKVEVTMARLRIGHCRLNSHLFKIGLSDTQNCQYCGRLETIEHFLLHCPRYYSSRIVLQSSLNCLGVGQLSVKILLGGGNFSKEVKVKICKRVCEFIRSCNRVL